MGTRARRRSLAGVQPARPRTVSPRGRFERRHGPRRIARGRRSLYRIGRSPERRSPAEQRPAKPDTSNRTELMSTIRTRLEHLLDKRILVLDGAMGTMIQRHKLTEADFRGERFRRASPRAARQQRHARADPSGHHSRHSRRVPGRRRRHHRDELVQRHDDRTGRLRARARTCTS